MLLRDVRVLRLITVWWRSLSCLFLRLSALFLCVLTSDIVCKVRCINMVILVIRKQMKKKTCSSSIPRDLLCNLVYVRVTDFPGKDAIPRF